MSLLFFFPIFEEEAGSASEELLPLGRAFGDLGLFGVFGDIIIFIDSFESISIPVLGLSFFPFFFFGIFLGAAASGDEGVGGEGEGGSAAVMATGALVISTFDVPSGPVGNRVCTEGEAAGWPRTTPMMDATIASTTKPCLMILLFAKVSNTFL